MESQASLKQLQAAMGQAASDRVFPGGVLLGAAFGNVEISIAAGRLDYSSESSLVNADTLYDLASLTKALSTAVLTMVLLDQGRLNLSTRLEEIWPEIAPSDKRNITITQLLSHTSGLPGWRPLYEKLDQTLGRFPEEVALSMILEEPLECEPGQKEIYSDLDYILLGLLLEKIADKSLNRLFDEFIAGPLDLADATYRPAGDFSDVVKNRIAPTEYSRERGGLLKARVHDQNAEALLGIAGHAGLFGTALDVWKIIASLRAAYLDEPGERIVSSDTVRTFWDFQNGLPETGFALGFDRPAKTGAAAGSRISAKAVGHLGFTGTSIWYDPQMDLGAVLLTNRVHPSRENEAIKKFRPMIHDMLFDHLAGLKN